MLHLSRAYRHTVKDVISDIGRCTRTHGRLLLRDRDTLLSRGRFCLREYAIAHAAYLKFKFYKRS